jgi:hypothetical protein
MFNIDGNSLSQQTPRPENSVPEKKWSTDADFSKRFDCHDDMLHQIDIPTSPSAALSFYLLHQLIGHKNRSARCLRHEAVIIHVGSWRRREGGRFS